VYLKRIEIYGFKSFATRCVLDFDYKNVDNITAIVGPNGSGKSNVADAIRWVTGEQSSKNLRSKKSEDVIFCGSSAKPRSSYAEVSLVLSSDKLVKFELNNKIHELTEIEVSRKLYRSGESEYLINHKKVRLSDIQQLLASLGFGQASYTVIGQGMVDRLLSFTASERKVLFDEAAGVKQYEIKREQAIRKLESTDTNLVRLSDILSELEPRVTNLRRLVKRAEGRKEFEEELYTVQDKYFGSLLTEYQGLMKTADSKKLELNKKVIQIDEKISDLQQKISTERENPHTPEKRELEEKVSYCTEQRDKLMREASYLRGQVESLSRNQSLLVGRKNDLESEKTALISKIDFLTAKLVTEQSTLENAAAARDGLEKPVREITAEVNKLEQSLSEPEDDKTAQVDELKLRIKELTAINLAAESAGVRLEELEKGEKALILEISEAKAEQNKTQKAADRFQSELNALEGEIRKLSLAANPESLTSLEKAMTELEGLPLSTNGYTIKLNKIFVQIRDIVRSINSDERGKLDNETTRISRMAKETSDNLVSLLVFIGTKESQLAQTKADISANKLIVATVSTENDLEKLQEGLSKLEGSVSERQNVLLRQKDALQGKLASARENLHRAEMEFNRLNTLVSNQRAELAATERRLESVEQDLGQVKSGTRETDDSELVKKLKSVEKELDKAEEDLAKYRGGLSQAISAEREFEQAGLGFERERRATLDEKNTLLAQIAALEVDTAKTQVRLEDLQEEIRVTGVVLTEMKHGYLDQMEKDVLKIKMENLRRKLETIGGVDPETEAEYNELETRFSEMSAQVTDLTNAKTDLAKVILELDDRIRSQFSNVFKNISSEFSRYFTMLFNGGNASLKLGEDEDGSFGIEITANPPGKRVQSLNALSGGERTLTSLALLFAILSVNPSPFCVLDEVDAALDESNTLRFVRILADLAEKTQFIVISHNRDTMKTASSLYGVTMNDEHISKLLSVKLTDALISAK